MYNAGRWLLGTIGLAAIYAMTAHAAKPEPLILAVHPYLPPNEVLQRFNPLADYLASKIGRPVEVRVGRDYEDHIAAIGGRRVDFAFIGPAAYIKLVANHGPHPLLARLEVNGKPYLTGVIVTRQDSPLRRLADLKGKRFAFGDPDSTMSHIVPLYMLIKAGVPERALGQQRFLGAHKNVALAVLSGDFDAGAVKDEVYQEYAAKGLRVLATLPPVSEHLFVTRVDLPAADVDRLRSALLGLKTQPDTKKILSEIHRDATALVPVTDADYDSLRTITRTVDSARH